MYLFTLIIY